MADLTAYQRDILIRTALGEAAGEGEDGMADVLHVILNRAASGKFPSDPAAVALQDKQFSAWNSGEGGNNPSKWSPGSPAYKKAARVLDQVVTGSKPDQTGGALYYHTPSVSPSWARAVNTNGKIVRNGHVFYPTNDAPSVATEMSVRQPPRPVTPSARITASRNKQNMTPAADLSVTERTAAAPFLNRDGSGVHDVADIVFGKQMTTRLAQKPGQSRIERRVQPANPALARPVVSASDRVRGNEAQTRNVVTTIASIPTSAVGGSPTTRKVTSVPVRRSSSSANVNSARSEQAAARGAGAPARPDKPGVIRTAGALAGSVALPAGVRPVVPSTRTKPGQSIIERATKPTKPSVSVAGFSGGSRKPYTGPAIPGPNGFTNDNKLIARLPATGALAAPGPVGVRPAVQSAAMIAARAAVKKVAPVPAVRMAAVVPRAVTPYPVTRSVAVGTQRSVARPVVPMSAVARLQSEGMTPSQAYAAANQQAKDRAEAGATKGHTSSGGVRYDPDSGGWKWTG